MADALGWKPALPRLRLRRAALSCLWGRLCGLCLVPAPLLCVHSWALAAAHARRRPAPGVLPYDSATNDSAGSGCLRACPPPKIHLQRPAPSSIASVSFCSSLFILTLHDRKSWIFKKAISYENSTCLFRLWSRAALRCAGPGSIDYARTG